MSKRGKQIAVLLFAALIGFAVGYGAKPARVEVRKEIVEVEKTTKEKNETVRQDVEKNKKRTTTEITKPDGTKIKRTRYTENTNKSTDRDTKTKEETTKETQVTETKITENKIGLTVGALAGTSLKDFSFSNPLNYGAFVHKTVLGPIGVGVWGLNNGSCGLSVGLSF